MSAQVAYTKSELGKIGRSLDELFAGLGDENKYARAANSNLVVLLSTLAAASELESYIDSFLMLHPARFFVLVPDNTLATVEAEISARCQLVGKGEHLCTEVVRLRYPQKLTAALPNIIQANLITGSPLELLLFDAAFDRAAFSLFLPMAEVVIFDSADFPLQSVKATEQSLLKSSAHLLDFKWLALGAWRDQIKLAFEKPAIAALMNKLARVELTGFSSPLLAGWLKARLAARSIEIAVGSPAGTPSVQFTFTSGERISIVKGTDSKGQRLETVIELGSKLRFSAPYEEENHLELLKRYYSIGESIANYRDALRQVQGSR